MKLQAHFKNIQSVIIEHLHAATSEVLAAVAWFTDREIFDVLCKKAQAGLCISVSLLDDEINKAPGSLNFQRLIRLGGKVTFLPVGSDGAPMMHHTLCVVDGISVIAGTYSWSKKSQINDENITVITEAPDFADQCRKTFCGLMGKENQSSKTSSVQLNNETIRRRLEMARNLILLGEHEDLPPHIQKLHPVAEALRLKPLLSALEQGAYKSALEMIEAYLARSTALVLHEDNEVPKLKFQLKVLELRLQSLSDENSDLERVLVIFNRRYNDALGVLLIELLRVQAELAKHKAERSQRRARRSQEAEQQAEYDERQAEQAEQDWQQYKKDYDQQQKQDAPNHINDAEEKELKELYRKSRTLCHPDKFEAAQKEAAHQMFVRLQDIYKGNDLPALRELHKKLKSGNFFQESRSSTLSRSNALRAAIAELQYRITVVLQQMKKLYNSDGADLLRKAGNTESEWVLFFVKQEKLLQSELQQLCQDIALYGTSNNE